MKIHVINVEIQNKEKYQVAEVAYKNLDSGKTESKKIMSFVNKHVFDVIKSAKNGDQFHVKTTKDEKNFWQWSDISSGGGNESAPVSGKPSANVSPSPRSTYETPEERAQKQIYIVRQSSVSSAIDLLKTDKKAPSVSEVLETAKQFEDYVFGTAKTTVPLADLPVDDLGDDVPF